jgi:hypothetical protein
LGSFSRTGNSTYSDIGNVYFAEVFRSEKIPCVETELQLRKLLATAPKEQVPVRGLLGVRIANVIEVPKEPFDMSFQLKSGDRCTL